MPTPYWKGLRTGCLEERRCEFRMSTCSREQNLGSTWGGIGNTLPRYTQAAMQAYQQNCSIRFHQPNPRFQLQQHLLESQLMPAPKFVGIGECAARALASNPSASVAKLIHDVHKALQTSELRPGLPRSKARGGDCCSRPERPLLGLHIRTLWADHRDRADSYRCNTPSRHQRAVAVDEVHALFQAPSGPGQFVNFTSSPTLRTVIDAAVAAGRQHFGQKRSLSLFVASDSEATREFAVAHARQRHGLYASHVAGPVVHNNMVRTGNETTGHAQMGAAVAIADLLLLSQVDMLLVFGAGSTFPDSARMLARCSQPCAAFPSYYMALNPLARALFHSYRNDSYLSSTASWQPAAPLDCMRDCFRVDPHAKRAVANASQPLFSFIKEGHHRVVRAMSSACRHACACWFRAGLGSFAFGT